VEFEVFLEVGMPKVALRAGVRKMKISKIDTFSVVPTSASTSTTTS
jgi:hypothetical protein